MNAERLLALYDKVAEAPDAIPRLRRFVLDLAVRGKLVAQDSGEEAASELVKEIEKNRNAGGAGKKRKSATFEPTPFDGELYDLPVGWEWVALAAISDITMGQSPPGSTYNTAGDGVPLINGPVEFTEGPFGKTVVNQFTTSPTNFCEEGDLLICVRGSTTGRTNIAAFKACIGRGVAAIRSTFDDEFIRLFLWKSREDIIAMGRGIAFPSVNKKQIENLAVPLPPLAEQRRIVAKVEELTALLDRLEAARTAGEATRDRLTAASLARLTSSDTGPDADPAEFPANARFVLDTLPALTTRPDQIKPLRQTILNLAVRGKLVEQDPTDEPASELLDRLRSESAEKQKAARASSAEQAVGVPFECPPGWAWAQVRDILAPDRDISYGVIKLGPKPKSGGVPTLRCSDVRPGFIDLSSVRKVEESIEADYTRTRLEGGEVLINIRGTLGGVALVPDDLKGHNVAREVAVIPIAAELSGPFLVHLMLSPYFWDHIQNNLRGIAYKGLNLGILRDLPIPLPPLAEQHRILTKVDALMVLCDQLEAALTTIDTNRARLLEALLYEALTPVGTRSLEAAE